MARSSTDRRILHPLGHRGEQQVELGGRGADDGGSPGVIPLRREEEVLRHRLPENIATMTERDLLLSLLDQAFDRRSWHGTNLRGSLRRVDAATAAWRPRPGRHNIWELAVHCAYWKYAAWRRLSGAARASFSLRGSNWFERPAGQGASEAAWREDVRLLEQWHRTLRQAVAACPPRQLDTKATGSRFSLRELVAGAAAHDLYHAGQIQLLKRLASDR